MTFRGHEAVLDNALERYWEHPSYWSAWRMAFETETARRQLVGELLPKIPSSWGRVDFFEDYDDSRLLILFTHNIDSDGARKNEYRILATIAGTGAVRHFGAEGTSGEIDLKRFRDFPHQESVQPVVEYLFRERKISPLVAVMFSSPVTVEAWGIEDPVLYEEAKSQLIGGSPEYWNTVTRRVPVLYENMMLKMEEWGVNIAGMTITDYNFWQGHKVLSERRISHAGITASLEGKVDVGRTVRDMSAPPSPLEQLFESEDEDRKKRESYRNWRDLRDR